MKARLRRHVIQAGDQVTRLRLRAEERVRASRRPSDPNVVGFDKYRTQGSYHWRMLGQGHEEYRRKADLVADLVGPADRCLDLGAGDGAIMGHIARRCLAVTGIDADFHAVEQAKRELRRHDLHNCTIEWMPLGEVSVRLAPEAGSFDVVYSMDVIEHLPRPEELLEVALAMVKPAGTVVVGTPLYLRDDLVSRYHVREFRVEELRALVAPYLEVRETRLLPDRRLDGELYDPGFVVLVASPRAAAPTSSA